jgi:glutaminyl-tRNA synthetase
LKYAYIINCTGFKKDGNGEIVEIYATYDPETRSGSDTSDKKVKGTLGWVSASQGVKNVEIRIYDRLFLKENMNDIEGDFKNYLNPNSLELNTQAVLEPAMKSVKIGDIIQFERIGYFRVDEDTNSEKLLLNRTIGLKDTWGKTQNPGE